MKRAPGNIHSQNEQHITAIFSIKMAILFTLVLSILTQGEFDPTLFNLMTPPGGIRNIFGVVGALTGGTILELFGLSSLLALILFLVFTGSGSPRSRLVSIKICLIYLLLNPVFALSVYTSGKIIPRYFGLWGVTSVQIFMARFEWISGIVIISAIMIAYIYVIIRDLKPNWLLFYFLLFLILGVIKGVRMGYSYFTKSLDKISGIVMTRFSDQLNKIRRKSQSYFIHKINTMSGHGSISPESRRLLKKAAARQSKKLKKTALEHAKLVFHSHTKQLLHQAITVYQKTNYPGNDTKINSLEN